MNEKQLQNIAFKKCYKELESIGLKTDSYITIKFNNNKSRYGVCKYRGNTRKIEISKWMHENDQNEDNNILDTIIHELIHAFGVRGHGEEFKNIADKVNKKFGYNVSRTGKAKISNDVYKYVIKCEDCGQTIGRHRNSKFVRNPHRYSCGVCGGDFKRIK